MAALIPPVSFDHRDAGTAESEWVSSGLLESVRSIDLSGLRRLIVLAAHPDDESLGAGGLIAEAASRGVSVTVVVVTDGEASHPDSPTLRPADLAAIRRVEVRSAVARLAPRADLHLLGLPDGRLCEMVGPLTSQIAALVEAPGTGGIQATGIQQSSADGIRHREAVAGRGESAALGDAREGFSSAGLSVGDPRGGDFPDSDSHGSDSPGADLPGSYFGGTDGHGGVRRDVRPHSDDGGTWLVAPWLLDNHPDHASVAEAARRISGSAGYRLLEYPIWGWHWARPNDGTFDPELLVAVDLPADSRRVKERAMGEHRSQLQSLSAAPGDEAVVPDDFQEHFLRSRELFVNVVLNPSESAGHGSSSSGPGGGGSPGGGSTGGGSTGGGSTGGGSTGGASARGSVDGGPASGDSLDRGFFDGFYTAGPDPWGFESRWYEKRKRAITMAGLPRERFASAFEPGCSIGVLTAELAERCDHLLATDISQTPLAQARRRLNGRSGVTFEQLRVPQEWPAGMFDLIVLSEIGYYCGTDDLSVLIRSVVGSLTDDGVLLACHWRHPVSEYPLSGDEVHARIRSESGLQVLAAHVEEDFRLDIFVRPPAISVARRDGLLG